jgi:hypothetical protein
MLFYRIKEYGFTFKYISGNVIADDLSRIDIHSLKIQESKEEILALLSRS